MMKKNGANGSPIFLLLLFGAHTHKRKKEKEKKNVMNKMMKNWCFFPFGV